MCANPVFTVWQDRAIGDEKEAFREALEQRLQDLHRQVAVYNETSSRQVGKNTTLLLLQSKLIVNLHMCVETKSTTTCVPRRWRCGNPRATRATK
jgi:hypothetical protein